MNIYVLYVVLGLGAGALYAAIAQALVLGYRGSGLVNLGQGAMAMIVAYAFADLRNRGRLLVLPIPNPLKLVEGVAHRMGATWDLPSIPTSISLGSPLSFGPAFALSMCYAALLGAVVHYGVYRPLRYASGLTKIVASVGVMIALQSTAALRFGTESMRVPRMLPSGAVTVLGARVPIDRLLLALAALLLAFGLAAVFRFSRFGLATEAAAVNEQGAIVSGLDPDRLAALNWVLSSVIGGALGILFASITNLTPTNFTFFVLPALGAALLANLRSFLGSAAAGMAIGVAQSITVPLQQRYSWFPSGAADGVPFIAIVVALMLRGQKLPMRGSLLPPKLPHAPETRYVWQWSLGLGAAALVCLLTLPYSLRGGLINSLSAIILALSIVVLTGFAGQVSLMQMAIAGMSALSMTRIAGDWGVPFPVAPLLAALVAALFGVIASLPALRIRGVHLAIATLGAALAFQSMVLENRSISGNADTVGSVPPPRIGGLSFGINGSFPIGVRGAPSAGFGIFVLVVAIVCCIVVANVRRGRTGRAFLAVRSNERSAAAIGLNVSSVKVIAFSFAAFLAGLAGAVDAYRFESLNRDAYLAFASATALALVYLAGISSISGAVVAGLIFTSGFATQLVDRFFHVGEYQYLAGGVGLILMAVHRPDGSTAYVRERFRNRADRPRTVASDEPTVSVAAPFKVGEVVDV